MISGALLTGNCLGGWLIAFPSSKELPAACYVTISTSTCYESLIGFMEKNKDDHDEDDDDGF